VPQLEHVQTGFFLREKARDQSKSGPYGICGW